MFDVVSDDLFLFVLYQMMTMTYYCIPLRERLRLHHTSGDVGSEESHIQFQLYSPPELEFKCCKMRHASISSRISIVYRAP